MKLNDFEKQLIDRARKAAAARIESDINLIGILAEVDRHQTYKKLGYTTEARERAARLPAGDAVRLYVSHDDVALERSARDAEANYEARYLFLTRLCHGASLARWQKFYDQAFAANSSRADAALSTELFVRDFAAAGHIDRQNQRVLRLAK